jgi:hypothetical protein
MLPRNTKQRTAGDQTGKLWTSREKFRHERCCGNDVLEVVQDEQSILPMEEVRHPL